MMQLYVWFMYFYFSLSHCSDSVYWLRPCYQQCTNKLCCWYNFSLWFWNHCHLLLSWWLPSGWKQYKKVCGKCFHCKWTHRWWHLGWIKTKLWRWATVIPSLKEDVGTIQLTTVTLPCRNHLPIAWAANKWRDYIFHNSKQQHVWDWHSSRIHL